MKSIGEPPVRLEVATGYGDDGTKSKKLVTDTGSVHTVMYNEDLLIEILLRLPMISLLLYKVVSKHWFSVITSPNFTSRLSRIPNMAPASGLFLQRRRSKMSILEFDYDFFSLDSRIPSKRSITTCSFCSKTGCKDILDSCNGLLLFRSGSYPYKLYVYNPTTNLFKMLPQHSIDNIGYGVIMAFNPTKSPHYKVVSPQQKDGVIEIQIYSSETNSWSVCSPQYPCKHFYYFNDGVYWNDAIHWLHVSGGMPLHAMLDVVDNTISTTKLPRPWDMKVHCDRKFFRSRGCLLLLCKEYIDSRQLFVYEMRNWNSGWFVKYSVNLDDVIMNPFPKNWSIRGCVRCYVLGEREEDPFMVINFCEKVFEYKPLLKTFRELLIMGTLYPYIRSHEFSFSFAGV